MENVDFNDLLRISRQLKRKSYNSILKTLSKYCSREFDEYWNGLVELQTYQNKQLMQSINFTAAWIENN